MRKKTKNVIKRCSFCGKLQDQVLRIIDGPQGLFICNECVNLCREMLRDGAEKPNVLSGDVPFSLVPIIDVKPQKGSSQRRKDALQCSFCGKRKTVVDHIACQPMLAIHDGLGGVDLVEPYIIAHSHSHHRNLQHL